MAPDTRPMRIRVGFELAYELPKPTPFILTLGVHQSRAADIVTDGPLVTTPSVPYQAYRDSYGNDCIRLVAPAGRIVMTANSVVRDSGQHEPVVVTAGQHPVETLPAETLLFLLGSRYCETEQLSDMAWARFSGTAPGWPRVQAICDFVHSHLVFGYAHARPSKTALQAFEEGTGVCRDYAHLAVALCRCMNIPARYCTGYLGDIGMPPPYGPMDFAGWFEAYLGGQWYTFDARNNEPRIGRVLIARGRDAADVAISTAFGQNTLSGFKVWTDQVH